MGGGCRSTDGVGVEDTTPTTGLEESTTSAGGSRREACASRKSEGRAARGRLRRGCSEKLFGAVAAPLCAADEDGHLAVAETVSLSTRTPLGSSAVLRAFKAARSARADCCDGWRGREAPRFEAEVFSDFDFAPPEGISKTRFEAPAWTSDFRSGARAKPIPHRRQTLKERETKTEHTEGALQRKPRRDTRGRRPILCRHGLTHSEFTDRWGTPREFLDTLQKSPFANSRTLPYTFRSASFSLYAGEKLVKPEKPRFAAEAQTADWERRRSPWPAAARSSSRKHASEVQLTSQTSFK